jgi:simple sugar transport system ATP-binding protein
LTPQQIDSLLDILLKLKEAGKTIIFISHKLEEIKKIADTATVIRAGKKVAEIDVKQSQGNEIAEAMVGRKLVEVKNSYSKPKSNAEVLNVINLTVKSSNNPKINALENFNVQVKPGEIVAIAGVEGNGQKELVEVITGLSKAAAGGVVYKDLDILKYSVAKRYELGMSHIPEDRHKYGMLLDFTVQDNIVIQELDKKPFSKFGLLNSIEIKKYAQKIIKDFDVRGARGGVSIARGLSGGNQQKAVVGRELRRQHDLLIVVQPTRGLDIGAIEYIHAEILKEKEAGSAILLVSYELSEVMTLADRIVVINDGRLVGEVPGKGARREQIGALMAGKKEEVISNEL